MIMTYKSEFLNILDQRGFIHQCSDFEGLDQKLMEGVQSAYTGYDPTAKSLHVGHMMWMMMLHWFQQAEHKPIFLSGGGTAMIGDPTFKDKTRPLLSREDIDANIESIKRGFSRYAKFGDGPTDAILVNNADWLLNINYMEFLRDYGTHFTINRMMTFDSVKLRLEREQPLTFLEFNYMIMQGYDFVELHRRYGTILQMGGSDQWGNMINGVELGRKKEGFGLFTLTCPLLTTASGAKMGKTEGGAVWLNADLFSPYDFWQYWRNTEDADVIKFMKLFTTMKMDEIARMEKLQGSEINEAKKILAFEVTKFVHGEEAATAAAETARKTFEQGGVGDDLPTINVAADRLNAGVSVVDLLVEAGLAASKGEAKRLIEGGGAKFNDQPVTTLTHTLGTADMTADGYIKLSAGKKKHALIRAA
ncbi:MAG: tyrS [Micavibrio sp.]|nr:tyrS [Micavibrio sp.]